MSLTKHKTGSANPKVYVALLTQTYVSSTSGLLVVGKTYQIDTLVAGDDFANVGYVAPSTPFIATGTTPTAWTNLTEVVNMTDSAPVATILENTLSGIPVWTWTSSGVFYLTLNNEFPSGKSLCPQHNQSGVNQDDISYSISARRANDNAFIVRSIDNTVNPADNLFTEQYIEIRVYP